MSNLDNLVNRLLEDGKQEAAKIGDRARSQADEIIKSAVDEMEAQRTRVLSYAESEAKNVADGIIENRRFEVRNSILQAKQKAVDNVFRVALERLEALDRDSFFEYLKRSVAQVVGEGEEILLPKKYGFKDKDVKTLNDHLKKVGKPNVKFYEGDRDISGGFILLKEGIEKNNTFSALLNYNRYELELAVIDQLFGKGVAV